MTAAIAHAIVQAAAHVSTLIALFVPGDITPPGV
jgi:hypothetical protein